MNAVDFDDYPDIRLLAGSNRVSGSPLPPFSDEACAFLDDVSRMLMKDKRARQYPDVISFAFWCRKGNVLREKELREPGIAERIGRGLAFHIAPGNVPVNFAFSYAFSLLAGNATVVRCPSKAFVQVEAILDAMRACFKAHEDVFARSAFITYPSSSEATRRLSEIADVRVIWGGDKTVSTIRALPSKPRCVDISFSDRYSVALLKADSISALDDEGLAKLARGFYNDTYLMDQNACSSPQTVLWVGDDAEIAQARTLFWDAVEAEARKRYEVQAAVSVDKHVQLAGDVVRGTIGSFEERGPQVTTAFIAESDGLSTSLRGVGGFFYEKAIARFSDVADSIDERYQTIVQFGFDAGEIRSEIISLGLKGVDRIVDVGSAMDIGIVWDGFDLVESMSRVIVAK